MSGNKKSVHKNNWLHDSRNRQVNQYLEEADVFIPDRAVTRDVLANIFSWNFENPAGLELLELGCGNGFVTAAIASKYPDNSFTLLDGNRKMLDEAAARFGSSGFAYIQAALEDCFTAGLAESRFDFIYSSNAIHHLDQLQKTGLYQQIYTRLNHGGLFLNIDVVHPASERSEDWQFRMWRDQVRRTMLQSDPDNAARYDDLPWIYKRKDENKPGRLLDHLDALEKTGFRDVDCFYKNGIFTLYGGRK